MQMDNLETCKAPAPSERGKEGKFLPASLEKQLYILSRNCLLSVLTPTATMAELVKSHFILEQKFSLESQTILFR